MTNETKGYSQDASSNDDQSWRYENSAEAKAHEEKFLVKTQALDALRPSGQLKQDALALLEAVGATPSELDVMYQPGFYDGDEKIIMKYLTDLQGAISHGPTSRTEVMNVYDDAKLKAIARIIEAFERNKPKDR